MARKKKPGPHINLERWLVSYADYVTLLFATFTCLYGISVMDMEKLKLMREDIIAALNVDAPPAAEGKTGVPDLHTEGELAMLAQQIQEMIIREDLHDKVKLKMEPRGIVIQISDTAFFESGDVMFMPDAKDLVGTLGGILNKTDNPIRVEGHADNRPTAGNRFRNNWDISSARASSLVHALIEEHKMNPSQLSVAGYGEHRPVARNDSMGGRQKNRRVEIVVLRDAWGEKEFFAEDEVKKPHEDNLGGGHGQEGGTLDEGGGAH